MRRPGKNRIVPEPAHGAPRRGRPQSRQHCYSPPQAARPHYVIQTNVRARIAAVADGLCLAATPIFALLALWGTVRGVGAIPGLCGGEGAACLDRMPVMYALMSVLHAAPWLRRIAGHRGAARRPPRNAMPGSRPGRAQADAPAGLDRRATVATRSSGCTIKDRAN
ncbi:hypothetical protein [Achromobacter ruhlandii]|uniref:hypothetical protein n=1 Tax=Achromobacter ruhlandii TaxID=72557 RepID=UPI001B8D0BDC|nr:hypothetical protein [Achromobacter ruhlandii]